MEGQVSREHYVRAAFEACDVDRDGRLRCWEMRPIADVIGFVGTDEQWFREFEILCIENGIDVTNGISWEVFRELVNDHSHEGCYCTTKELAEVTSKTEEAVDMGPFIMRPSTPLQTGYSHQEARAQPSGTAPVAARRSNGHDARYMVAQDTDSQPRLLNHHSFDGAGSLSPIVAGNVQRKKKALQVMKPDLYIHEDELF